MKRFLIAAVGVLAGTYGMSAHAQEEVRHPSYFEKRMAAPTNAFEIGVSGMYNQGFGNLTSGQPVNKLQDTAGAGGGGEIDLGWRLIPHLSLGVFAAGAQFGNQLAANAEQRTLAAGVQGQWFFRPYDTINPWVSLATAYRAFWIVPDAGGTTTRHGWEIARVQAGVDFRMMREISVGPFVGGGVDTFFTEKLPGGSYQNISGPPVSGFVQAGIMGRFDLAGQYATSTSSVAAR
jgi:hypothetical protein